MKCKSNNLNVISFHKNVNGFRHFVLENSENMKISQSTFGLEDPGKVVISMAEEKEEKLKLLQ